VSRDGLKSGEADVALPPIGRDEFGQLTSVFRDMLATLRTQWASLHRLDHFRREAVSNLSHDLRSPLTATAACLETLDARFANDAARADDRQLLEVALRNTRNAARLVQSLGDLAQLDEPQFALKRERLDVAELLGDIALRFEARAAAQGVALAAAAGLRVFVPLLVLSLAMHFGKVQPAHSFEWLGTLPAVIAFAVAQLGKPYRYAGAGPDTWDCSGLTMVAWAQAGVSMPHGAIAQGQMFPRVSQADAQPGDLVVFRGGEHIGIYVGNGTMIHAPHTGDVVRYAPAFRRDMTAIVRPG